MPSDPSRVNLARHHATQLSVRTTAKIDVPRLADWLSNYAIRDSDGSEFAVFHTLYRRSRTVHSCLGSVVRLEPESEQYSVDITYSTSEIFPFPPPARTKSVKELIDALVSLSSEELFSCRARFEYPRDRYLSRVPLPVMLNSDPDLPFTEIRGMRFAKLEDDSILYDAVVDHGGTEEIVGHSIGFVYAAAFALGLPNQVLATAVDISEKFGGLRE